MSRSGMEQKMRHRKEIQKSKVEFRSGKEEGRKEGMVTCVVHVLESCKENNEKKNKRIDTVEKKSNCMEQF